MDFSVEFSEEFRVVSSVGVSEDFSEGCERFSVGLRVASSDRF